MTNDEFWKKLPELSENLRAKIGEALAEVIDTLLSVEHCEQTDMVHQLAGPQQRQLLSWIDQALQEVPHRVRNIAAQLERDARELQKTEETLRKIPADDVLKPLLEELHGLHQELVEVSKQTLAKEEQLKTVELQLNEVQRRYDEAAKRIGILATHTKKIAVAERVQKALEEYKDSLIEKKVVRLQETVSECFNTLSRKKDALRRITIDPRTFAVALYDRRNQPLPKTQLSAGEKQIYAISMLWALAKISGRPLPIIIDTPSGDSIVIIAVCWCNITFL